MQRGCLALVVCALGCDQSFLHDVPSVAAPADSRAPKLQWAAAPRFVGACGLVIPGRVTFDAGADFDSASGTLEKASGAVTSDASGLAATITDLSPGRFGTSWSVNDSAGLSSTLHRDLTLAEGNALRAMPRRPDPALGEQLSEGSQALLPGCATCTGGRGAIAAGDAHTCAITTAGQLKCWGFNDDGELGDGTSSARIAPVLVCASGSGPSCPKLSNVVAVAAGVSHTCAVLADKTARCWGDNASGQLGTGDLTSRVLPTTVCASGTGGICTVLSGVVAVSAGYTHTCAVLDTGEVRCWGDNGCGQLGDGLVTTCDFSSLSLNPVVVCNGGSPCTALDNIVDVVAARQFSCALQVSGGVLCWGHGEEGELGAGNPVTAASPQPVVDAARLPLTGVVAISASYSHTCVLTERSDVRCWGFNRWDQPDSLEYTSSTTCGDGTIDTGEECDDSNNVNDDGCSAKCGDDDLAGALGNGTGNGRWAYAVPVCATGSGDACTPITGAIAVSAGRAFTCALMAEGTLRCWGDNYYRNVGDAALADQYRPAAVCPVDATGSCNGCGTLAMGDMVAVSAGGTHACALRSDGRTFCWGGGLVGQLGNGDNAGDDSCVPVSTCDTGVGTSCATVSAAAVQSCHYYAVTP